MLHFADDQTFPARLRVMQIITLALLAGVLTFLTVVLVQPQGQAAQGQFGTLSLLAVALLAMQLPMAFLAPRFMAGMAVRQLAADPQLRHAAEDENVRLAEAFALMVRHQAGLVISLALLEAVAFLGLLAYMLERHLAGLIVAGIAMAGMVLQFPTRFKVVRWVENRQQQLDEIRQRG